MDIKLIWKYEKLLSGSCLIYLEDGIPQPICYIIPDINNGFRILSVLGFFAKGPYKTVKEAKLAVENKIWTISKAIWLGERPWPTVGE